MDHKKLLTLKQVRIPPSTKYEPNMDLPYMSISILQRIFITLINKTLALKTNKNRFRFEEDC